MKLTKEYLRRIIKEAISDEMDMGDMVSKHRGMGKSMDDYDMEMEMGYDDDEEMPIDTPEDTDSEIMSRLDDIEGRLEDLEMKAHGKKHKETEDEDEEEEEETIKEFIRKNLSKNRKK